MNIAVIFTGGTIGSRVGDDGLISPMDNSPYLLLDKYEKENPVVPNFTIYEPYRILSENLSAENLTTLVNTVGEIYENSQNSPGGIIITHGTDTIQYTACVLQYVFGSLPIPVLLVSSAFVLDDPRANGYSNFEAAVSFINKKSGTGVFVPYKNKDGLLSFHRGTRMIIPEEFSSDMKSFMDTEYARLGECGDILLNEAYRVAKENIQVLPIHFKNFKLNYNSDILRLRMYPGISYPAISKYVAVIIESYHSGTICINEDLRIFAKQASSANIPIYLVGSNDSEAEYETVAELNGLGIITLPRRSFISQYVKLWIASSNNLDIGDTMSRFYSEDYQAIAP